MRSRGWRHWVTAHFGVKGARNIQVVVSHGHCRACQRAFAEQVRDELVWLRKKDGGTLRFS